MLKLSKVDEKSVSEAIWYWFEANSLKSGVRIIEDFIYENNGFEIFKTSEGILSDVICYQIAQGADFVVDCTWLLN